MEAWLGLLRAGLLNKLRPPPGGKQTVEKKKPAGMWRILQQVEVERRGNAMLDEKLCGEGCWATGGSRGGLGGVLGCRCRRQGRVLLRGGGLLWVKAALQNGSCSREPCWVCLGRFAAYRTRDHNFTPREHPGVVQLRC